ncbi:glycosyltransferase [Ferruginibacter sp. SUN002]|uniref:glycosyltransferase n=1 Tax=Ferruginibacter sp. SUN002 TaxID=2937789 RepID=UPI003D364ECE
MSNTKQILYISYDGMTDPLGQSQVLPYIAGLSKHGYQFTLLSCEKPEAYKINKEVIETICKQNNIDWQPAFYTKKPPVLSTIKDIRALSKKAFQLHNQKQFAMVHCRSYLASLIGLKLKQKFGVKFLFDMRGFWIDERLDGNQWNFKNPIYKIVYRYFKKKEKQFLENADHTICLTYAAREEMFKWKHIEKDPLDIAVIPCCADAAHFDPAKIDPQQKQQLQHALGIQQNEFVLSYLGGLGLWYMLSEMLDFFKVLLEFKPDAKFLIVTANDNKQIWDAAAEKNIPAERIVVRKALRKEVPLYVSLSTLTIYFIKPTYSKMSSSLTKQGEIMAMGIPAITNLDRGDTASIVEKYDSGIVVNDFSTEAYKNAILNYLNRSFDHNKIREGALDYFDLSKGITKYNSIYKILLSA